MGMQNNTLQHGRDEISLSFGHDPWGHFFCVHAVVKCNYVYVRKSDPYHVGNGCAIVGGSIGNVTFTPHTENGCVIVGMVRPVKFSLYSVGGCE